jgi:hypothetical protein
MVKMIMKMEMRLPGEIGHDVGQGAVQIRNFPPARLKVNAKPQTSV